MSSETPAREPTRKSVTVVVSDVSGSTTLGERLDAASLGRVLTDYNQRMRHVLERHGATVERFLGNALVGLFGVPQLHEDDALRAVRAAAEMREEVSSLNEDLQREWGVPIAVRTGVNTGTVIAGASELGPTLLADEVVSLAVRLQQVAHPGEILLGETTHDLVRDAVTVEPVAPVVVDRQPEPSRPVRLLMVSPVVPGHSRRLDSAMVGRDREHNLLHEAFERVVRDRTCHLFTVLGPAGIGKSRLGYEFRSTAQQRATVLWGRCLPYGEGITLWPLISVIRQATGLAENASAAAIRAKLLVALAGEERAELIAERVAAMTGMGKVVGAPPEHFWAVRKLLESVSRRHPLVVVFDDLHWAEPTFLDLVEHLADWSRDSPILLVCVARPELLERRAGWGGGKLNATSITLEPLTGAESQHLMANLLGQVQLTKATWDRVCEAAEGNPLFLEELLAMLIDEGLLRRHDGHWEPAADLTTIAIPPTIWALLSARLDQLDGEERAVLERASVVGKVFYLGAVSELLPENLRLAAVDHLARLIRKDLIRPFRSDLGDEDAFRFRHILIRDAAYEALPKALRAELHERFALWVERRVGEHAKEYEEIVAYHLERAFRYREELRLVDEHSHRLARQAAERLIRTGYRALVRGDMPAAAKLLRRARELLPEEDPARAQVSVKLGEALAKVGLLEEAETVLSDVEARAVAIGDRGLQAYALIERTFARIATGTAGGMADALDEARQAIEVFEELGEEQGLTRAWNLVAELQGTTGRQAARQEAMEHALTHARSTGDEREEAWAIWGIVGAMAYGPTPTDEVVGFAEAQLQWARARGHRWLETGALMHLGQVQAMRGRFEEARDLVAQSRAICEDLGLAVLAAALSQISGAVERLADDVAAAERELRRGHDALEALGETSLRSTVAAQLAHALCAQERYQEAETFAKASNAAALPDDVVSQVLWRGAQAKVLVRQGEVGRSEDLAREAVTLADGTDMVNMQAGALLDLAEVLLLSGRPEEAATHDRKALRLYERKGNLVAARRERDRLRRLRPAGRRNR